MYMNDFKSSSCVDSSIFDYRERSDFHGILTWPRISTEHHLHVRCNSLQNWRYRPVRAKLQITVSKETWRCNIWDKDRGLGTLNPQSTCAGVTAHNLLQITTQMHQDSERPRQSPHWLNIVPIRTEYEYSWFRCCSQMISKAARSIYIHPHWLLKRWDLT